MASVPDDGLEGLSPIEERGLFGIMPNSKHQHAGFLTGARYELAFVEFDDQGRCYDRQQMEKVGERLDRMREDRQDALVFVFVHGWKHNARTNDSNLISFRELLGQVVDYEAACTPDVARRRPVLGIFIGWRGLTTYGPTDLIAGTTFLGRQEAGHRVATGSPRELFGRLRHYRNSRLKHGGGSPLLVIAGHSFGGMIVYSALAQSLIEAATDRGDKVDSRFADLVLLINPAIEGARYLPIYDLLDKPVFKARTNAQLPVFICAQATNDRAVGTFFPIGNMKRALEEAALDDLERRCITHAIGFIDEFKTHTLAAATPDGTAQLDPPGLEHPNPFWVVRANPAVIDQHSGIWQASFKKFLASLLFRHVDATRDGGGGSGTAASALAEGGTVDVEP